MWILDGLSDKIDFSVSNKICYILIVFMNISVSLATNFINRISFVKYHNWFLTILIIFYNFIQIFNLLILQLLKWKFQIIGFHNHWMHVDAFTEIQCWLLSWPKYHLICLPIFIDHFNFAYLYTYTRYGSSKL